MDRLVVMLGAINGALAVVVGAFGAHGLKERLDANALAVFETGARYHMYHALAMVLAGALGARMPGLVMQVGIVLFSGSLYALALTGTKGLGAITPFGGLAFIVGWIWLAIAVRSR